MMSDSPVANEIRALIYKMRPHNLRPMITEEPVPARQYEPGPCAAILGRKVHR